MVNRLFWYVAMLLLSGEAQSGTESAADAPDAPTQAQADLRERLTARQDKRRAVNPWTTEIAGRPLTVSGEFGFDFEKARRRIPDSLASERERRSGLNLEVEAFYSINDALSLFAQWRLASEKQRSSASTGLRRSRYVERGEMWLHSRDFAGSGLNLEIGRLKFEDERRWWWDEDLDALRVSYERDELELSFALARELGRNRSDRRRIDAQQDGIARWIAQVGWDWRADQKISLFVLHHDDRSNTERLDQTVPVAAQDGSDARLTWIGASLHGEVALHATQSVHYWFDLAHLAGHERSARFEPVGPPASQQSVVTGVSSGRLGGWAVDAGVRWHLPLPGDPRLSVAHASTLGGTFGADRAFRQSGLHTNQNNFGGMRDFSRYGAALDPELSNLRITTIGLGLSIPETSSVDIVYHRYRQVNPSKELREARIPAELTGLHTGIGSGLDLVATFYPSQSVELSATVSTFRSGKAFGSLASRRHHYAALALRVTF